MIGVGRSPCSTCPYRAEYGKLPRYDGDVPDQAAAGAFSLFFCHQNDGNLCAGWVGCHDMINNLAVRMRGAEVDPIIYDYVSSVPLFDSGAEAAEHGLKDLDDPSPEARRRVEQLLRKLSTSGN